MHDFDDDLLIREDVYWDAFVSGQTALHPIDPELAKTVARTHALDDTSAPDRAFVYALKENFMKSTLVASRPNQLFRPRLVKRAQIQVQPRIRPDWFESSIARRAVIAAIAAVFLALIGGIGAYRYTDLGNSGSMGHGPAVIAPATPSPAAVEIDQTLVEIVLPADAFPTTGPDKGLLYVVFNHLSVAPNTTASNDAADQAGWPGPTIVYVLDGELSLVSEGTVQVIRGDGDGTPEKLLDATEVELGPGDTVALRSEVEAVWSTTESSADLLLGVVAVGIGPGDTRPDEWGTYTYNSLYDIDAAPTGLTRLKFRQVAMEPDGILMLDPDDVNVYLIDKGGPGLLAGGSDGSITLKGATETTIVYVFSVEPAEASATPTP